MGRLILDEGGEKTDYGSVQFTKYDVPYERFEVAFLMVARLPQCPFLQLKISGTVLGFCGVHPVLLECSAAV